MRFLLALLATLLIAAPASADRIKDLGGFQGIRSNQLTGYGIVVGLPGTGDDNLEYTVQSLKAVASRFGLRMIGGGVAALIHGVLPFVFTTTGSRTIAALNAEIVAKRAHETEQRSVEFVI